MQHFNCFLNAKSCMIEMSNHRGRKRKIVNSPLRLFNESSPVSKALKPSLDSQPTKLRPAKIQKRLSAELDYVSNKQGSSSSSDELVSPIAKNSFYNKDIFSSYLTPMERKTQRELLESISGNISDQVPQIMLNSSVKPVKKEIKVNKARKPMHSVKPQQSRNHQKSVYSTTQQLNKEISQVVALPEKHSNQMQSPKPSTNVVQNKQSPNKGSPRNTPQKGHVYHKGTPKSKLPMKYKVKSVRKSAQKGIQMYVLGLDKGKKNKQGKAAKQLEKVMKETKKKSSFEGSSLKTYNMFDELKIEGIEPLEGNVELQSTKTLKNLSLQKSPRRSPRKCVRNLDSPGEQNLTKHPGNGITETPESLSHQSQSPTDSKMISDATPKKTSIKLFPVFTPPTSPNNSSVTPGSTKSTRGSPVKSTPKLTRRSSRHLIPKLKDKRGLEQMTLDAGQKKFGALKCQTCGMVYTAGHPEDEADHDQFHKKFLTFIKFPGWKSEHVLEVFDDGRIIQVTNKDPKYCKKKVEEVRELVDHELGFPDGAASCSPTSKTLLFISMDNKVAGCLIAEEIKEGYRVISDNLATSTVDPDQLLDEKQKAWCCSNVSEPVVCGISRIWATSQMRRRNIAKRMVDCLRMNYIFGTTLSKDDIAFSDPTPDGKFFATSYCGTKSFLVYKYR